MLTNVVSIDTIGGSRLIFVATNGRLSSITMPPACDRNANCLIADRRIRAPRGRRTIVVPLQEAGSLLRHAPPDATSVASEHAEHLLTTSDGAARRNDRRAAHAPVALDGIEHRGGGDDVLGGTSGGAQVAVTPPPAGVPLDRTYACAAAERAIEFVMSAPHRWAGSCMAGKEPAIGRPGETWHVVRAADAIQRSGRIERTWWLVELEAIAGAGVDATVLQIDGVCLVDDESTTNCAGDLKASDAEVP